MYKVETLEKWNRWADKLHANGYTIHQSQYRASDPNGLHVWFWKDNELIEIVTHNEEVEQAMIGFNNK